MLAQSSTSEFRVFSNTKFRSLSSLCNISKLRELGTGSCNGCLENTAMQGFSFHSIERIKYCNLFRSSYGAILSL